MSYHKGDVKQNAVNIAFAIVQAEGGKKLTMRHLADEIGISHTALYRHYKNKDAVLLQVATKGFTQLMLQMAEGLKAQDKD
ncbi:MAG: TetR/AcrR family transcriptional regulator, partial [OCS116 cluster bacterium]|nr:TetR/AcrR family transcriptional regulator [OCS116 cluster bacterium]